MYFDKEYWVMVISIFFSLLLYVKKAFDDKLDHSKWRHTVEGSVFATIHGSVTMLVFHFSMQYGLFNFNGSFFLGLIGGYLSDNILKKLISVIENLDLSFKR